jgi:hypothetical protein
LLRKYGASPDLPRLDRIGIRRASSSYAWEVFTKGTNDWNQFSLFELIAVQYNFLGSSPGGQTLRDFPTARIIQNLPFPDFARLRIRKPARDLKTWQERTVDLGNALDTTNCAADLRLEWGDTIEIPEADHPLSQAWTAISDVDFWALSKCLERQVKIIVKGRAAKVTLAPESTELRLPRAAEASMSTFWLKPALKSSGLLLTSSDLSHVKVTRKVPANGKPHDWVFDCSDSAAPPAFWLRDGDVIEVPERP